MNCRPGSGLGAPSVHMATTRPRDGALIIEPGLGDQRDPFRPRDEQRFGSSSTATPPISETDSLPPSRGDPSSTVTCTASSLRKNAAASPEIPAPITTCGCAT